jgi:hypothetical protein
MSQRITKARFLVWLRKAFNDNNDVLLRNGFPQFGIKAQSVDYYKQLFELHPKLLENMLIDLLIGLLSNPLYKDHHKNFFESLIHVFALELQTQLAHNVVLYLRNAREKGHKATKDSSRESILLLKAMYMLEQHNNHCYEMKKVEDTAMPFSETADKILVREKTVAVPFKLQIPLLTDVVVDADIFSERPTDVFADAQMMEFEKEAEAWFNAVTQEPAQAMWTTSPLSQETEFEEEELIADSENPLSLALMPPLLPHLQFDSHAPVQARQQNHHSVHSTYNNMLPLPQIVDMHADRREESLAQATTPRTQHQDTN